MYFIYYTKYNWPTSGQIRKINHLSTVSPVSFPNKPNKPNKPTMIPRFSNPHLLLQSTKVITRADLDAEDEENSEDFLKEDSRAIEQLHRLLGDSLLKWDASNIRSNKRRKTEENDQVEEEPVRMYSLFYYYF